MVQNLLLLFDYRNDKSVLSTKYNFGISHSMDFTHSQQPDYTSCAWSHEEDNTLQGYHDN